MHVSWSIAKPLKTLLYSNSTLVLITETEKQTESYSLASLPVPAGCRPPVNGAQVSRPEVNLGAGARHNAAHCWTCPPCPVPVSPPSPMCRYINTGQCRKAAALQPLHNNMGRELEIIWSWIFDKCFSLQFPPSVVSGWVVAWTQTCLPLLTPELAY